MPSATAPSFQKEFPDSSEFAFASDDLGLIRSKLGGLLCALRNDEVALAVLRKTKAAVHGKATAQEGV